MQDMEKRALIAVVLCLGILFGWQALFFKKSAPPQNQVPVVSQSQEHRSPPPTLPPTARLQQGEEVVVETELYKAIFSTQGASLKSFELKKYKDKVGDEGKPIQMVTQDQAATDPLALRLTFPDYQGQQSFLYNLIERDDHRLLFRFRDRQLRIEREYVFQQGSYEFKHHTRIWHARESAKGDIYIGLSEGFPEGKSTNILLAPYQDVRNFIYHTQEDTEREKLQSLKENKEIRQVVQWAGIENRYFVSAIINRSSLKPYVYLSKPLPGMGTIDLQFPFYKAAGKDYFECDLSLYLGPKIVENLQAVDSTFDEAVDFGIFSVICIPLLKTMNFFYRFCKNFGIAIILLTLLIRVLFHPLTKKSLQSMREMQRIQPQIAKLKEKFKEDRQQMNKEVMELMRANKVNPLGGCLPLLFQMPIFFALYRVLYNAIELYQAPFFGWIQDLSAKDPYFISPVLMGIAMFLQQKLTPTATVDPVQQKMMMLMPIIFSFMMIPLPAGLVLYILFSTAIQVASQVMVNREFAKKGL